MGGGGGGDGESNAGLRITADGEGKKHKFFQTPTSHYHDSNLYAKMMMKSGILYLDQEYDDEINHSTMQALIIS